MPRKACSNENGEFDEILLKMLTDLTKLVDLWKFCQSGVIWPNLFTKLYERKVEIYAWFEIVLLELRASKSWRIWRKWQIWTNVARAVEFKYIILSFGQMGPRKLVNEDRRRSLPKWQNWRNLSTAVNKWYLGNIGHLARWAPESWRRWRKRQISAK